MNFDIKDVKTWANRYDVRRGDKGYFFDDIHSMKDKKDCTAFTVSGILDDRADCFCLINPIGTSSFTFFLPLDKVKEDKPKEKKYRPLKNLRELTEVVRGKDWTTAISTGEELLVRCKYNKHRIKVLITRLEFDNNLELVLINNKAPKVLLENYEVMNVNGKFMPFGVEMKDDE